MGKFLYSPRMEISISMTQKSWRNKEENINKFIGLNVKDNGE